MPEIFTIIFDCRGSNSDPVPVDDYENCENAKQSLIDFLDDHHISYYYKYITDNELADEMERLDKSGYDEVG